ncbi:tetratricopeptide repeat protein [Roseivirga sp. UBA1976]|mgnify:CR=1 FL=1|uniref:tetratricopeptide repeat protein n=1 Tax=Roseivirga sp. UBA1976 TaxID=1947386 RepID=UPI002579C720|nr:tetratricopeptide repeat protein [Roseivirga sp. UBA1976]
MKNFSLLALMLFLGLTQPALAQEISTKKLINNHFKAIEKYKTLDIEDESMEQFIMRGTMAVGEIKNIPLTITYWKSHARMEMEFMGAKMIQVSNDSISWTKDPFAKGYTFEKEDGDVDALGFDETKAYDLKELIELAGWEPLEVKETVLDSLEVYELMIKTKASDLNDIESDLTYSFYFEKDTYFMIGVSHDDVYSLSLNYDVIDNILLPTVYLSISEEDGVMRMDISEYDFETSIDAALFEMTQEVREAYSAHLQAEKSKTSEPSPIQILFEEGVSLLGEKKYDDAIKKFNKALEINANDNIVLNRRGLAKLYSGDTYGAIADFGRAMELADSTEYPTLYNNLGLAKYYLGDYKGARADYEKALAADSFNINYNQNMGLLMFRFDDYEGVDKYYSRAIAIDSTVGKSYYHRAIGRAELGKYEEAYADYVKAGELGVDLAEYHNYKAVTLYRLERYSEAGEAVQAAIERDSTNNQYYYNLAEIYEVNEEYNKAVEQYNHLLRRDSTLHRVYAARALAYWELSLMKAARADIDKAISMSPESAVYYDYRAYIKEEAGDYTGAIEDYTSSLNLEQDANIYYRRGLAKINISNKFDACTDFKKAAELGNEDGKQALSEHCKL